MLDSFDNLPAGRPSGLSLDAAMGLLLEHLVADEAADLDRPHVLVSTDQDGLVSVTGPFPDAQAALCALDYEQRTDQDFEEPQRAFVLAPMLPGLCDHTAPDYDPAGEHALGNNAQSTSLEDADLPGAWS